MKALMVWLMVAGSLMARGASLTPDHASNLNLYASTCVRYFTSSQANNRAVGFTHAFFGTGSINQWRSYDEGGGVHYDPWSLSRGYGSHVNMNEVSLRFLVLAVAFKTNWLNHISAGQRYAESWGQILTGLQTLRSMQVSNRTDQIRSNSFHRAYLTATNLVHLGLYDQDRSLAQLGHDGNDRQSSDDNGLLWMNLLTLEGLANDTDVVIPDRVTITNLCNQIRAGINLRRFYYKNANVWLSGQYAPKDVIVFELNNGLPSLPDFGSSQGVWDRMAAEGPLILAALYLSGQITVPEFYKIARDSFDRKPFVWTAYGASNRIGQASYQSAMFMHGVRALHGFPITANEAPGATYFEDSLGPVFRAQRDYAETNRLAALASQPMTQPQGNYPLFEAWTGPLEYQGARQQVRYPGNEDNVSPAAGLHVGTNALSRATAPHAFFFPLCRPGMLSSNEVDWLLSKAAVFRTNFFRQGASTATELGWEAVIPWHPTNTVYAWVGGGRTNYTDWGRPFEALNAAYIVLSIFDALNPFAPLASYNVEKQRIARLAGFYDRGIPLPHTVSAVQMAPGSVSLAGSEGIPLGTNILAASSDIALPPATWTYLATNRFDSNGTVSVTNVINPASGRQFYFLIQP